VIKVESDFCGLGVIDFKGKVGKNGEFLKNFCWKFCEKISEKVLNF
jgi:hypothetical protein